MGLVVPARGHLGVRRRLRRAIPRINLLGYTESREPGFLTATGGQRFRVSARLVAAEDEGRYRFARKSGGALLIASDLHELDAAPASGVRRRPLSMSALWRAATRDCSRLTEPNLIARILEHLKARQGHEGNARAHRRCGSPADPTAPGTYPSAPARRRIRWLARTKALCEFDPAHCQRALHALVGLRPHSHAITANPPQYGLHRLPRLHRHTSNSGV